MKKNLRREKNQDQGSAKNQQQLQQKKKWKAKGVSIQLKKRKTQIYQKRINTRRLGRKSNSECTFI